MIKLLRSLLLLLALLPLLAPAQTVPALPPTAPAGLQGTALRDWLRVNWYDPYRVVLSYADARAKMYNYADNYGNQVVCVYSGYSEAVPYNFSSTSTSVVTRINCEHSIPQSWFNETVRMRSDMHHLFPTYDTWNGNRGSDPYADIPDTQTTLWMRLTQSQAGIPAANIDEYSEDGPGKFEPREDHKGNLARAAFYFFTMHAGQPDLVATGHNDINTLAALNTLYQWHLADPVDAHEQERNRRVAASQGNYNPYIADPSLVARAWGFAPAGPAFSFATATGRVAEGNGGSTTYSATLTLSPAATAATTVQVALDASSTAGSGSDFTFAAPATVTFAAGQTTQTVNLTVLGDTTPEPDETVVLALQNPSSGTSLASPATHTLTIANDDGPVPAVLFTMATGSLAEGNSGTSTYQAAVRLRHAGGSVSFPLTVAVAADAGSTATAGSDYTLGTTSLTFASATDTSKTVLVSILGDTTPEPNETVVLHLSVPAGSGAYLGSPGAHTLTILNDDAAPSGSCAAPYFTKYFESSTGNTKAVEIFNPTSAALNLASLRVSLYAAGSTTPTTTATLSGTLAPGAVYVIANTGVTDAGVRSAANLQSAVCFFSGTHSLALFSGTDTLDVIGIVGNTPPGGATGWAVASGGSTRDNSLVRLPSTGRGSSHWFGEAAFTWQAQGTDNFAGIGSYASTACSTALAARPAAARPTLELYPNPATTRATLRLPTLPAPEAATAEVLDALGRVVLRQPVRVGATLAAELDLAGLPAGLYAVRVATSAGTAVGRLVVE